MEWKALIIIAMGALLTWGGWRHWHYRNEETISILEAAVLNGEEPLPQTRFDKIFGRVQAVLGLTMGPFLLFIGTYGFFNL